MDLVIAEKDMLARDIARAMCGVAVSEDAKLPISGGGYTVAACSGHLLELQDPAEVDPALAEWALDALPISFNPWPKQASSAHAGRKLETLGRLLDECDGRIIHAGDPDDEGQLIVDEVLEHFGFDPADDRVWRVYVNDSIGKNIRRAFEQAVPNAGCISDGKAALARQLADFSFGVSESRLASLKLRSNLPIGRVQTPTLRLVVDRDKARESHEQREFYELTVIVETDAGEIAFKYTPAEDALEDGKHCFDKALLEEVAAKLEGVRSVFEVKHAHKSAPAPLPFNLTGLTSDLGKRFKMTPSQVMEATQALRDEHHAITYNRTDSSYLKEEHYGQAPETAHAAMGNLGVELPLDFSIKSKAFDDAKVSAHHGIIPQEVAVDVASLPKRQKDAYAAIAMRYLCLFLPDAQYIEAKAEIALGGLEGKLSHTSRLMEEPGWLAHAPESWLAVKSLAESVPAEGEVHGKVVRCEIASKTTSPPAAFTSASLVVAMANIARYVKDKETREILKKKDEGSTDGHGSIGTTATRAAIVEGLVEHGYLDLDAKKNTVTATAKGRKLIELVPEEISGADLSARWYLMQQQVKEGSIDAAAIMEDVCAEFERHKDTAYEGKSIEEEIGACPRCGKPAVLKQNSVQCSSNRFEQGEDGKWELAQGCGWSMALAWSGKKITETQARKLIGGGKVAMKGCKSAKTGKKFDCSLSLDPQGKLQPEFSKAPVKKGPKRAVKASVSI